MGVTKPIWNGPVGYLRSMQPDVPVNFFAPEVLQATARRFVKGFPGLVTYAVKANPAPAVIENLLAAGIHAFDVASVAEIDLLRRLAPDAALHFNNPVRSRAELRRACAQGVRSFSVDSVSELEKLAEVTAPEGIEVSVRIALPVAGAAYDFGKKFGARPDKAVEVLTLAAGLGFTPSMTFHPGTQCTDPQAWVRYIDTVADIAARAGVTIARLNVGGGFPAWRADEDPDLEEIFAAIDGAVDAAFGPARPALLCEPGRAMVANAFCVAARVRAVRDGGDVFLNDGVYGLLAELPIVGPLTRVTVVDPQGNRRTGPRGHRRIFGPTCDSLDILPEGITLPADIDEDDYVIFAGAGAYSTATLTRFNGFGDVLDCTVRNLEG